jgi:hypothetical protein
MPNMPKKQGGQAADLQGSAGVFSCNRECQQFGEVGDERRVAWFAWLP